MTIRYVGSGGSDVNSGLTWALRKLTLNGVEDTPVVAGDTVYVGPGTYRELLTVDVSGTAGNPITYIGDYLGQQTDGVGGVVRVTGSDNDTTAARASCITATTKHYRTFTGFAFDITSAIMVTLITGCTDWAMTGCTFSQGVGVHFSSAGAGQLRNTIRNCLFAPNAGTNTISFTHNPAVDNAAHVVENCLFLGPSGAAAIGFSRVGGNTVRNCTIVFPNQGIAIAAALTVGQTITVNNCVIQGCRNAALVGTVSGEIVENYNAFFGNGADRTNTATGANSNSFPALFDPRWFFQLVFAGAGPNSPLQVVSPFDLSSYSQLVNLAGTSPPATDLRGTSIIGATREWGPLEYDPTLNVAAASNRIIATNRLIVAGQCVPA